MFFKKKKEIESLRCEISKLKGKIFELEREAGGQIEEINRLKRGEIANEIFKGNDKKIGGYPSEIINKLNFDEVVCSKNQIPFIKEGVIEVEVRVSESYLTAKSVFYAVKECMLKTIKHFNE